MMKTYNMLLTGKNVCKEPDESLNPAPGTVQLTDYSVEFFREAQIFYRTKFGDNRSDFSKQVITTKRAYKKDEIKTLITVFLQEMLNSLRVIEYHYHGEIQYPTILE